MATKFTAEFLERRMAEHKRWQEEMEYRLLSSAIDEVQALPKRAPKTAELFEADLDHLVPRMVQ